MTIVDTDHKNRDVALTTIDNPYDPFVQYYEWYAFDEQMGYHTCSYLARICEDLSYDLSEEERDDIIEDAMNNIVAYDPFQMYKKVYSYD